MQRLLLVATVLVLTVSAAVADNNEWIQAPGGAIIHKSCFLEVASGTVVDASMMGRCNIRAQRDTVAAAPGIQIYSIDTHWTTTNVSMRTFDASFACPGMPPKAEGQINYFWPGFKSTEPTMGLPVVQPVLQYGQFNEWVVRSWYVFGNQGEAVASTPVPVQVGDVLSTSMSFDESKELWTIVAINTRTKLNTTLHVTKQTTHNTDFKVAMLVLETIMPPNECGLLPAKPSTITFTGVKVNGKLPPWTPRTGMSDCNKKVAKIAGDQVTFSWTN